MEAEAKRRKRNKMAKEKLNLNRIALTAGIVAAIMYALCALVIVILPVGAGAALANTIFHGIDFSSIATKSITMAGFLVGLIVIFIWGWLIGALFALVYNWLDKK